MLKAIAQNRLLRTLLFFVVVVALPLAPTRAQAAPVIAADGAGAAERAPPPASPGSAAVPWVQIVVIAGGAWLGSVLARRVMNSGWFSFIGARLGAMVGVEALAGFGALWDWLAGAAPATRTVQPAGTWTI